jgi:hypothetical protein
MEELYNQLYKDGKYTKTFEDFQVQFGTPEKSEKLYTALNQAGDYTKSFGDFQTQFSIAGKTNDSANADPSAESGNEGTGFKLEAGSSEPRDASDFDNTQEKDTAFERQFGKTEFTDFFGDLYRAWDAGTEAGGSVNEAFDIYKGKEATDEEVYDFLEKSRKIEEKGQTDEMIALSEKQAQLKKEGYNGVSAFFLGWWDNPSAMLQYSVMSLSQMGRALVDSEEVAGTAAASAGVGAGLGAAAGLAGGPLAPITSTAGAITGSISGFFGGLSGAMETGMTTAALIQEKAVQEGLDWASMSDKERFDYIRKIQNNEEEFNDLKSKAVARGIAIGAIDSITAGITGGAGAAASRTVAQGARSSLAGAARVGTVAAIETTGGMLSEIAGQAAAGQEFNLEEILIEGFADKTFTGASIIQSAVQGGPKYSINGEKMNGKRFIDNIKILDDEAFVTQTEGIKVENSPAVEKLISDRRQNIAADQDVDSRISDVTDRTTAINLVKEQNKLKNNKTGNKTRLTQIQAELDGIAAKYADSQVDATIEQRKEAVANAVDNAFEASFNKNYKAVSEAGKKIGLKTTVYKTEAGYKNAILKAFGELPDGWDSSQGVFAGEGKLFINKPVAKRAVDIATGDLGGISVASHEALHPMLNALVGDATTQGQFVSDFKKQMTSKQKKYVSNQLKARGYDQSMEAIELMNIFSDGIIKNEINYDQTTFEKLGNVIVNFFRSKLGLTTNEISFDDGRSVFNFLKEYNNSLKEGKVSDKAISAIKEAEAKKGAKVSEAKRLETPQLSKTQLEGVKNRLSGIPASDITSRVNVNKISAELPAMIGTQINNRFANLDPDTREEFTFDVLEKILRPNKEGVNKDLQWDGRGDLYGFLNGRIGLRIKDAVREDYNRAEGERMYVGRIDAKQLEDLTKEPSTEPTTETGPKNKTTRTEESVERGQATFDELDIVDDALIKDIKSDLEKEIRVRVQKGTLSETVAVKKGRETYLVSWLEDYVNKQLFKKLSKRLGAIGERNGETVIPGTYIDFLNDPKTFDIVTKALPIKSIKKSYNKLFPTERIGRELTAEGNPVFRIKKIDKKDFLTYFVAGKKSTILERQKQLFREILEPLAKQVVADFATPENIASLKEIQELAPAESIDVIENIVIDAQLNNLESKLDRYKGEKASFDIIQFSRNINKENTLNALDQLEAKSGISEEKKAAIRIIRASVDDNKITTAKDLIKSILEVGRAQLSTRAYREFVTNVLTNLQNTLKDPSVINIINQGLNEYGRTYKYQQKIVGFNYAIKKLKADVSEAVTDKDKAAAIRNFLNITSRSIRTLGIENNTTNEKIFNNVIVPAIGKDLLNKLNFGLLKKDGRTYITENNIKLKGLAQITEIKSDFQSNVKRINSESLLVRNYILKEIKKAKTEVRVDDVISFINLSTADQRGLVRKLSGAGVYMIDTPIGELVLEHETTALEIASALIAFANNKINEEALIKLLDNAKVNLIPKTLDTKLNSKENLNSLNTEKINYEGGIGRYKTEFIKNEIAKLKKSGKLKTAPQFSKTNKGFDPFGMADIISRQMFPNAFVNKPNFMRTYENLNTTQQKAVRNEMERANLLQFSKTLNKAKAMANRPDASIKGISVWDFDDTLATTKSNVLYTLPDGTKGKINATEFALKADKLGAQGAEFDFSEFSKVMEGAKGPMFEKAIARNKRFGNSNVYILTARPADSKYAIHEFLKGIGLDIKIENIVGLGDGTAIAKAKWIISKVAEGYNDFYFADDAYKNVKAVQEVLEQADVKSKVHQAKVQFSKNLNKDFNNIIQDATGISATKDISTAKSKILARKKGRFKFFIPPSADDFAGLLYKLTGKGAKGEQQQAWFKQALFDPFAKAMREFESYKQNVTTIVNQLKKDIKNVPAGLKKINESGFTNENAVRVYLWVKNGYDIDGLNQEDIQELVDIVEGNQDLLDFADQMDAVLDGYPEPQNDWLAGTITTDAINMINTSKRAEFLQEWQQNADVIFSKENLNKLRAAFGENYVEALQDMLYRMKTGRNRPFGANKLTNQFMNWVNDSVGTIMFFNTRSALLQTLSTVNFINWGDNNPIAAAKAFANQKQFWSDFAMLFNSDFLKQRRSGLKNDVNADDIANAAETATNKTKAVLSSLLKVGFLPTQIADSFAIALGGASFVRNRINKYVSEGMGKQAAEEQAFLDFQEIAEETQQSSRPDRISQQQASPLGRIILAFANTPMQYMRLTKKAFLDLKNKRGDAKTNITKIVYYMAVQNIIFSSLQAALFAALFDDDEEALEEKELRVANSMLDSILRGTGIYGAIASTLKNIVLEIDRQAGKDRPDFTVAAQRALSISPPIDSKMRKLMSAARAFSYKTTREKMTGYGLDNPAYYAVGQIVSATTNIPLDRAIRKADNLRVAMDNDTKYWQSIALTLGYSQWDVGLVETSKNKKKKTGFGKTTNWKKSNWNKDEKGNWKKD